MTFPRESRRLQRTRYELVQHFDALDADADEADAALRDLRTDLNTAVAELKTDIKGVRSVLVGLMVTFSGAILVGAVNLLFKAIGG